MKRTIPISKASEISPVRCELVQEVFYNFTQYAFIGGAIRSEPLDLGHFPKIIAILRFGTLTQQDLAAQSLPAQRVFYEILTQYIMFFTMNPDLLFPPDFLTQSSAQSLGPNVTKYMADHEWPFPQMLKNYESQTLHTP
ncbi:hypothetical protein [Candidatus Thiodictyon syntrophicum]|jgi:hypothetical protein|uniref:hypothetical protein n=1 Tax=Candidatus Thiodictyon syntrophicum TaxID=1166950 RepID=UPI0012FDC668|nr:hypothetical protein [Candidatus Thiodictyon syntrophicum]